MKRESGNGKVALVSGGCGQIGSHVVDVLLERGYEKVIVLDPTPPRKEWAMYIEEDRLVYRHGMSSDLRQVMSIATLYDIDEIYDFGAFLGSEELTSRWDTTVQANFLGARNLYELAKMKDARMYHISIEFAGYGFTDGYSVSKEMAYRTAVEYAKKWGVFIVSSFSHHVFCERQKLLPARKIMPTLISYAMTGYRFRVFGSPKKMMDLLYARDYAEIVVDLLNHPDVKRVDKHVYDIGVGYGVPLDELVEMTYLVVGREPNYVVMEDFRKQKDDPFRVAYNDWEELLGKRRLRGIREMLPFLIDEYRKRYSMSDFRLAVVVYEQRHRLGEWGV